MSPRRLALALVLVVVAASVGVGAVPSTSTTAGAVETPSPTPTANASESPLGERLTMVMQTNAAQAEGAVENGMWAAAFANASNESAKRALVERRVGQLNGTIAELQADRRALKAAFRNGTINRTTYRARLSAIVGRLSSLGEAIDQTSERGASVGVNQSRLDVLRTQARNLSGAEVSRLARNLTGGPPGLFEAGPPDQAGERGPGEAANRSNRSTGDGNGPPTDRGPPENESDGSEPGEGPPTDRDAPGNESEGGDDQGPPSDSDRGDAGNETEGGDGQGPPSDSDRGDAGNESEGGDGQGPPSDSDRGDAGNETEGGEGQGPPSDSDGGGSGNGPDEDGQGEDQPTATETESAE